MYLGKAKVKEQNLQSFTLMSQHLLETDTERETIELDDEYKHVKLEELLNIRESHLQLTDNLLTENNIIPVDSTNEVSILSSSNIGKRKRKKTHKNGKLKSTTVKARNNELLLCHECPYTSKWPNEMSNHIRCVHEGIKIQCDQCTFTTTRTKLLQYHIAARHEENWQLCDQCDFKSKTDRSLWRHKQTAHQGLRYPCDACEYKATRQSNLNVHKQSVHDNVKFYCEICNFSAAQQSRIDLHMKKIHEKDKFDV